MDSALIAVIGTLLGATLGAGATLITGWLSPQWVVKSAKIERREIVINFLLGQIDSYRHIIKKLRDSRGTSGIIQQVIINQIYSEYQAFERNREHLPQVEDSDLTQEIKFLFSDINSTAFILGSLVSQQAGSPPPQGAAQLDPQTIENFIAQTWTRLLSMTNDLDQIEAKLATKLRR